MEALSERVVYMTESVRTFNDCRKRFVIKIAFDGYCKSNGFEVIVSISISLSINLDTAEIAGIPLLCANTKRYGITGCVTCNQCLCRAWTRLTACVDSHCFAVDMSLGPIPFHRGRRTFDHCVCNNEK